MGFTIYGYLRYAYPPYESMTKDIFHADPSPSDYPPHLVDLPFHRLHLRRIWEILGFFQERGDHILSGSGQPTSHGVHLLPDLVVEPVVDVHGIEELTCTNHLLDMSGICGYMIM